jgi:hypothetical protein
VATSTSTPRFELQRLGLHVHAAEHHGAADVGVLGVELDLLGHLVGQFARGQQHQRAHRMARRRCGAVFVLEQPVQQGQREGGGLSGSGLGGPHHVLTRHDDGNGLGLDRRHGLVAHFGHGARQRLSQRKV